MKTEWAAWGAACAIILAAVSCLQKSPLGEYADATISPELLDIVAAEKTQPALILSAGQASVEALTAEAVRSVGVVVREDSPPAGTLLLADFDLNGISPREYEFPCGAWASVADASLLKSAIMLDRFASAHADGFALRTDYSLVPGRNGGAGVWIRFGTTANESLDLSGYASLSLLARSGSEPRKGSSKLLIELRNRSQVSTVMLTDAGEKWSRYTIPLSKFEGITEWREMTEMLVYVDAETSTDTEGVFYIDELRVSRE